MKPKDYIIRGFKYGYRFFSKVEFPLPECDCDRQSSNDKIYNLLKRDEPCMITRFGTTELNCINNYLCVHSNRSFLNKCWDYISDYTHTPWWYEDHFHYMNIYSGIFPEGVEIAERFSERYLADIPEIDLLGSFQYFEKFMPLRNDVQRVQLEMLYPFFVKRPWTRILEGKRVLVIHPFEATIKQQYTKRVDLFSQEDVLPKFELLTLRAVQSVAGIQTKYNDWFEALEDMENQIMHLNFDFAIIGCGAYGLPLAAFVKRMGKKAIHLGGGTQLLFGIIGNRWINSNDYQNVNCYNGVEIDVNYRKLFNESWCYPLDEDTPKEANKVDGACYWK